MRLRREFDLKFSCFLECINNWWLFARRNNKWKMTYTLAWDVGKGHKTTYTRACNFHFVLNWIGSKESVLIKRKLCLTMPYHRNVCIIDSRHSIIHKVRKYYSFIFNNVNSVCDDNSLIPHSAIWFSFILFALGEYYPLIKHAARVVWSDNRSKSFKVP